MSADPSCLGLDGPQTGPLTMELTTGEYCYFKKGKKERNGSLQYHLGV